MRLITWSSPSQAATTIILLCVMVAALATGACGKRGGYPGGGGPGGGGGMQGFPVSAAPIVRGEISQYASVTASVVAKLLVQIDDSTLRAQEAQQAANLAQVRAMTLGGSSTAQADLRSAQVAYQNAELDLRRNQTLFSQGYVSKAALDQAANRAAAAEAAYRSAQVAAQNASLQTGNSVATAQLASAQAQLAFVEKQIAQTLVRAPFDGVVTARNVDPGSLAVLNTTLMQVSQLNPVYVDAGIAGSDFSFVHVGTPVTVSVDNMPGRTWQGKIAYFNLAATAGSSIYKARIPLANPGNVLRAGMVANVIFAQSHKAGALLAPRAAVY